VNDHAESGEIRRQRPEQPVGYDAVEAGERAGEWHVPLDPALPTRGREVDAQCHDLERTHVERDRLAVVTEHGRGSVRRLFEEIGAYDSVDRDREVE
jgi:hypothetical protein